MALARYDTSIRPPAGRWAIGASGPNFHGHLIVPSAAPVALTSALSSFPVVYRLWGANRVEIRWNEPPQRNSSALNTSWPLPWLRSVASACGEPPAWA